MKPKSIISLVLISLFNALVEYVLVPTGLAIGVAVFFGMELTYELYFFAIVIRIGIEYVVTFVSEAWHGAKHKVQK